MRRTVAATLVALVATSVASACATPASAGLDRVAVWGSDGSGDGQLHYPAFDATDRRGNVYVADQHNSRVVKFSRSGEFLLTWGWGVKDGEPRLETCRVNCRTGLIGSGEGQLNGGYGIAVHSRRVYVTDPANDRVQVFTPRGKFLAKWGRGGAKRKRLSDPLGVAADSAGHIYVADTLHDRIVKFSAHGKFIRAWGRTGTGDGQFQAPWGLAIDESNHLYVTDGFNERVQKFNLGGRFLRTWGWGVKTGANRFEICRRHCLIGRSGTEKGQFAGPEGIATDSHGGVYVAASGLRVERFRPGGRYLGTLRLPASLGVLTGVAIDASDRVLVTSSRGHVVVFAKS